MASMNELCSIFAELENDISRKEITPFSSGMLDALNKVFSEKASKVVRNVNNCICDDGCVDKPIQNRIEPRVVFEDGVYKIYGNRPEDIFQDINKIHKKFGKNNTRTFIVGEYLYSLQHKYKIPNGRLPIKIGRTRITLDLNMETYIIYPNRQSHNVHYEVEI